MIPRHIVDVQEIAARDYRNAKRKLEETIARGASDEDLQKNSQAANEAWIRWKSISVPTPSTPLMKEYEYVQAESCA